MQSIYALLNMVNLVNPGKWCLKCSSFQQAVRNWSKIIAELSSSQTAIPLAFCQRAC